jgi:RNA polymerase sigma-70 factor, ECF subfamily
VRRSRTRLARPDVWQAGVDVGSDGEVIRGAVARLSDGDRAVIYRSYYLGRTTTQIAADFSTDEQLVKHDLHRALHALRATIQQRDDITGRRMRIV